MYLMLISLILVACGEAATTPTTVDSRSSSAEISDTEVETCTVKQTTVGADIVCGKLIAHILNGEQGAEGEVGQQGSTGEKGDVGANGVTGATGPQGSQGDPGAVGATGATGPQGPQGVQGVQGVQGLQGERGISGLNGTNGINGTDGSPGLPGTPGATITPVVPCPDSSGAFPEVLLCIDDNLYAVFVGSQTRYAAIPAGSYQTTDGRYCNFHVTIDCTLTY